MDNGNNSRPTMTRENVAVLHLARACCRSNVFSYCIYQFADGGFRINPSARLRPAYSFGSVRSSDVAKRSQGRFSTAAARRHLDRLARLGYLSRDFHPGWSNRYQLSDAFIAPIFDEAVKFYTEAGLSFDEIRHVPLPELP